MLKKILLKNSLRVFFFPMAGIKTVTILFLVGTGSKYERKEISGISHLLEHLFFKGTKKRPSTSAIAKELDGIGGIYNAFTGKEFMGFWIKVESSHLKKALEILADLIFHPLLREKDMEKEKKVIFEEINMIKDNPQSYIEELWEKQLYGNQPAGWMICGEKETLERISQREIFNYYQKQFVGENAVLVLAGNFPEKILSEIKKFFKFFKKKNPLTKKPTKEIQKSPQLLINFRKTDQTHLALGVRTFSLFSQKRYPLMVLANLLGGTMSSRLFLEVREKNSLAYYIQTFSQHYSDSGYLVTRAGVDNQKVEKAIEIILKEYQKMKSQKISQKELEKSKENLKSAIYMGLETSDAWAFFLASQEILKKEISLPERECLMIDKVKREEVQKIAREIFQPQKLNLVLIGPFKEKKGFKKNLKI